MLNGRWGSRTLLVLEAISTQLERRRRPLSYRSPRFRFARGTEENESAQSVRPYNNLPPFHEQIPALSNRNGKYILELVEQCKCMIRRELLIGVIIHVSVIFRVHPACLPLSDAPLKSNSSNDSANSSDQSSVSSSRGAILQGI